MPPCRVDSTSCTKYARTVTRLTKKYSELLKDLDNLYDEIAKDHDLEGECVPRLKYPEIAGKIWKYRCPDTTNNRGKSYGFRVIGFLRELNVMYLIFIYHHKDVGDLSKEDYRKLVQGLEADLRPTLPFDDPSSQPE